MTRGQIVQRSQVTKAEESVIFKKPFNTVFCPFTEGRVHQGGGRRWLLQIGARAEAELK